MIEDLQRSGHDVELMFFTDVPNKELRFYQAQADIVVDMLTFGMFGAGVREAMMLGKPVVCYLRPEWLDSMRREVPEYVDELPIVSATPETVRGVLDDRNSPYHGHDYTIFLQGSYKNDTNVYGDSDVDVVIRLNKSFITDLT